MSNITPKHILILLGHPSSDSFCAALAEAYAATDSVNQGIPLLQLSRTSAVARSLAELVELVTARRVTESRGLFDRLFSRSEA